MHLIGGYSPWAWLTIQAAITATVLHFVWSIHLRNLPPHVFTRGLVIALVFIATAVGFETSYLMPDFSGGLLLLLIALLLTKWQSFSKTQKIFLVSLSILIVSFHLSHILITVMMTAFFVLISLFQRAKKNVLFPPILCTAFIVGSVLLAISIQNKMYLKSWELTPQSSLFLFSRFYSSGPVEKYLEKVCPKKRADPSYMYSCFAHQKFQRRGKWSPQAILWMPESPMSALPPKEDRKIEAASRTLHDAFWNDPGAFVSALLQEGVRQLVREPIYDALALNSTSTIRGNLIDFHQKLVKTAFSPEQTAKFKSTLQNQKHFPTDFLNTVYQYQYFGGVALFLLIIAVSFWKKSEHRNFYLLLLVGIICNAIVCGGLSAVEGRYQLRVSWIPLFVVILVISRQLLARGESESSHSVSESAA